MKIKHIWFIFDTLLLGFGSVLYYDGVIWPEVYGAILGYLFTFHMLMFTKKTGFADE